MHDQATQSDLARLGEFLADNGIRSFSAKEVLIARKVGVVSRPPPEDWWPRIIGALEIGEMLRTICGHPLIVGNGYRPGPVNKAAGGAKNSQHLYFRAMDFDLPLDRRHEQDRRHFYAAAESLWRSFGEQHRMGLGFYSKTGGVRVHIDTTGAHENPQRWRPETGRTKPTRWGPRFSAEGRLL